MNWFRFVCGFMLLLGAARLAPEAPAQNLKTSDGKPLLGMYIHQHWAFNQPYAARTWTLEQWQGYLRGIKALGFNFIMIWPMLETMPNPLTPSDEAHLKKTAAVIDWAHKELDFRVIVVLCGNVHAVDQVAMRQSYYERNFFYTDARFDPKDKAKLAEVIAWRKHLLGYLKAADGVSIIDADPSGYVGSTNEEFMDLLAAHRPMLDEVRPGIELFYWINAPWVAYNRFYETGKFANGSKAEFLEALDAFAKRDLKPWGFLGSALVWEYAKDLNLQDHFITLTYSVIEAEPSFPLTRYTVDATAKAAREFGKRGTMGNAQTHMVQLPNTFAFARGAQGQSVTDADMLAFAEQLLPGHGAAVLAAWKAIDGKDAAAADAAEAALAPLDVKALKAGELGGLIFNEPARFVEDLRLQLRVRAALERFLAASRAGQPLLEPLTAFNNAAEVWQLRTGYPNRWVWEELTAELKKVEHPAIKAVLADGVETYKSFIGVKTAYFREETAAPRLLRALRAWQYSLATGMDIPADAGIPQVRPDGSGK